jgi:hypothetical protein
LADFTKEARGLLRVARGDVTQHALAKIQEALRAVAEKSYEDGYWAAEQDGFKRLTPNPYTKPNQGER